MKTCTKNIAAEHIRAILHRADATQQVQDVRTVCLNTARIVDEKNVFSWQILATNNTFFTLGVIKKGQLDEYWISRVKRDVLRRQPKTSIKYILREPVDVRLLREQDKLIINNSVILFTRSTEYIQIILPRALKGVVYRDLNINMGHEGGDRTLQLIRDRSYWPKMDE